MNSARSHPRTVSGLVVALALSGGYFLSPPVSFAMPPLPPDATLQRAVESAAAVQLARARLAEAQQEAALDSLGPYDWTVSGASARRRVNGEGSFQDWDTALERTVRLPGKAQLDRKIGQLRIQQATAELAVAQRSTHAAILQVWFDCLDARERARLLELDLRVLQTMTDTVSKRRRAGDLAELDEALATAELASVRADVTARRADAVTAARLLATWQDMPACDLDAWDAPPADEGTRTTVLAADRVHADPGTLASQSAAERAAATATRVQRDRWPDPTLGVTYSQERDGAERIGGLTLSIPIGVRRRQAEAARAAATATAATAEHLATRQDVERNWIQIDSDVRRAHQTWSALAEAELQHRRAADLSQRAFELGEASLADALLARRAALQAALVERAAALDSWRARAIYDAFVASLSGP
jgi:outer membrane protein TolC